MFSYILRSIYRGSGNIRAYILTMAMLGAILLMILYAPAGYLEEVLEVVPRPSVSISDHPPGIEVYYGYFDVDGSELLVISSRNTSEVLRLLIGRDVRVSNLSIGCEVDNPGVKRFLEDVVGGSVEELECMGNFIDYAVIVDQEAFQWIAGHCTGKVHTMYLRGYVDDGVTAPSAYTLARDLLGVVGLHQGLLYVSSAVLISVICLILGFRASNDIKRMLVWLSEMHIPMGKTFFYVCLVYLGATIVGVFAGYGLANLVVPLMLILLKLFFKIPYIYAGLDIGTIMILVPISLISFLSYILAVSWMVFRG